MRPGSISFGPITLHQSVDETALVSNPGIGGTEFSLILLAHELASRLPATSVCLDYVGGPLRQIGQVSPRAIAGLGSYKSVGQIVFAPVSSLRKLETFQLESSQVIAICQHPYDRALREVIQKFKPVAVVHVGIFSFWSNLRRGTLHLYVPNLMPYSICLGEVENGRTPREGRVGFLGALTPGKRFHEVAGVWRRVARMVPGVTLEVMGSSATHTGSLEHRELPTTEEYGEEIMRRFDVARLEDLDDVSFLGNVGSNKTTYFQSWKAAIVNPDGGTESFCYAWRELIAAGVPTLAGDREGMRELLHSFPQLRLRDSAEIPEKLASILNGDFDYTAFERSRRHFRRQTLKLEEDRLRKLICFLRVMSAGRTRFLLPVLSILTWPIPRAAVVSELFRGSRANKYLQRFTDRVYLLLKGIGRNMKAWGNV